jgi:hypothetical protein
LDLYGAANKLLHNLPARPKPVRLLGIAASVLIPLDQGQLPLFPDATLKRLRAEQAEDAIKARFGSRAITRAALLDSIQPHYDTA